MMRAALVLTLSLTASANASAFAQQAGKVRDSAGVQIVDNLESAWARVRPWTVSARPTIAIPGRDGDSVRFSEVSDLVRLSDGTIVVASAGTGQLVFYDRQGRLKRAVGRRGPGFRDFPYLYRVWLRRGDSLLVATSFADRQPRLLAPDGKQVRGIRLPTVTAPGPIVLVGPIGAGAMIGHHRSYPQGDFRGDRWSGSATLYRLPFNAAEPDALNSLTAVEYFRPGSVGYFVPVPLAPKLTVAVNEEQYCVGYAVRYEVNCYSASGKPLRSIRRSVPAVPVTERERGTYRTLLTQAIESERGTSPEVQSWRRNQRAQLPLNVYANTLPLFSAIRFDQTGHLWVRRYQIADDIDRPYRPVTVPASPTEWDVFAPDGRWLGTITLPPRFGVLDIGSDYVLGISRDSADREAVVEYRLSR